MEIANLGAAAAAAVAPAGPATPTGASVQASARFAAAMSEPRAGVAPDADAGAGQLLQQVLQPAAQADTLGSRILSGLRIQADTFSDKWRGVSARLDAVAERPDMVNMLRLQSDLLALSVQYEVVGKGITKSTQNLDALVRMN